MYSFKLLPGYPWVPFVETSDLLIWRQPHPDYDGLYIYKGMDVNDNFLYLWIPYTPIQGDEDFHTLCPTFSKIIHIS